MLVRFRASIGVSVLVIAASGCAGTMAAPAPGSQPGVETTVALTFEALTSVAPGFTPGAPQGMLPGSLYYLSNDASAISQVWRVEPDGVTIRAVTFEPVNVDSYAVSPVDGRVAYVSGNQLLQVDANGAGRSVLVSGGLIDPNNPFVNRISSPAWSPDGATLAYGNGGLNFYTLSTGSSNRVLEDQITHVAEMPFPQELYWPGAYSPDGRKLLVMLGYYEGISFAVYDLASGALVRMTGDGSTDACCEPVWVPDGRALYTALPTIGMLSPGMWRVDAASGAVTTLIEGFVELGTYNFAGYPSLGPDGLLHYFFASEQSEREVGGRPPLQMVRSGQDGFTGRTVLRPETFELLNEALWSPDASFVVAAMATGENVYQGGRLDVYYVDGRPAVTVAPFGRDLAWGP